MKKFWWVGLLLLLIPSVVKADGMMIPKPGYRIDESGQKAVIWFDGDKETMVLSTTFSGNAEDFAWVIPVPSKPEVGYSKDELFTALTDYTRPTGVSSGPMPMLGTVEYSSGGMDKAQSVTVVETKQVDIYDVAVLEATNATALREWLEKNGYEYPANKEHLLSYYVSRKWFFVAAKISGPAVSYTDTRLKSGHATPLKISFATKQMIYPLKISGPAATNAEGQKIAAYSFETGTQGWMVGTEYEIGATRQITQSTRIALTNDMVWKGKNALKMYPDISNSLDEDYAYTNVYKFESGKSYVYSARAMVNKDFSGEVFLRVKSGSRVITESEAKKFGPTKQSIDLTVTFLADISSLRFELVTKGMKAGEEIFFDAVQIEQGLKASEFSYEVLPGTTTQTSTISNMPIVLYVFSNHKTYIPGFNTEFAGYVKAATIEKFAYDDDGSTWMETNKKMYLTKLSRQMRVSDITDDLVIRDADDNNPVGGGGSLWSGTLAMWILFGSLMGVELFLGVYFWYIKPRRGNK